MFPDRRSRAYCDSQRCVCSPFWKTVQAWQAATKFDSVFFNIHSKKCVRLWWRHKLVFCLLIHLISFSKLDSPKNLTCKSSYSLVPWRKCILKYVRKQKLFLERWTFFKLIQYEDAHLNLPQPAGYRRGTTQSAITCKQFTNNCKNTPILGLTFCSKLLVAISMAILPLPCVFKYFSL